MKETWLPVVEFELYEVSNKGRIRSYFTAQPRMLKPSVDEFGYSKYRFYRNGTQHSRQVHRVVLEAFIGPCPEGMIACHGPKGPRDNSLENIYWATLSDNLGRDKRRDGTMQCGERHGQAVLTAAQVSEIRSHPEMSQRALAKAYGVGKTTIGHILRYENWAHLD